MSSYFIDAVITVAGCSFGYLISFGYSFHSANITLYLPMCGRLLGDERKATPQPRDRHVSTHFMGRIFSDVETYTQTEKEYLKAVDAKEEVKNRQGIETV